MKNRMQDLDFEQTVAFDSVKDFEFTRKAAQRFRQVVSLDGFEDEDADVIFHYLYKEMELVSFGDHLKRYIYERAGLEEPYNEVTQDIYRDIVVESFHETCTPKSMNPTSTKLTSLANNWLTQASVKRETVFLLCPDKFSRNTPAAHLYSLHPAEVSHIFSLILLPYGNKTVYNNNTSRSPHPDCGNQNPVPSVHGSENPTHLPRSSAARIQAEKQSHV